MAAGCGLLHVRRAGLGDWVEAERCFRKAAQLAPNFSFAAGNAAVALYQNGDEDAAMRQFRALLRRFPDGFDDM
jgi:Flp pilus assembly protein TadD